MHARDANEFDCVASEIHVILTEFDKYLCRHLLQ